MSSETHTVTLLLHRIHHGEAEALNQLIILIHDRLLQLAHNQMRRERPGHSLATGDLVNEGLYKLLKDDEIAKAANRNQLYRAFSRATRQLLIDHARRRDAARRGGDFERVELDDLVDDVQRLSGIEVLSLNEALESLGAGHSREADVVELRYFGGFEMAEIGQALGVSLSTVEKDHRFAKAWLKVFLSTKETS